MRRQFLAPSRAILIVLVGLLIVARGLRQVPSVIIRYIDNGFHLYYPPLEVAAPPTLTLKVPKALTLSTLNLLPDRFTRTSQRSSRPQSP